MAYRSIFDAKASGTNCKVVFDFNALLVGSETLSSATVTAAVYSGTDAAPSAIVSGPAAISGGQATQAITGGVVGVVYLLSCTGTGSAGTVLGQSGYLLVKA